MTRVPAATYDVLRVATVTRRFGTLVAVRDVSMRIAAGERRVVLGPNGAGKTTLFNMIAGDILPNSGRILLAGQDVTRLGPVRRSRLGLRRTFQTSLLFDGLSVRDNLFMAVRGARGGIPAVRRPRTADRDAADYLADRLGLAAAAGRLVATLSHGERRQVELAMALAGQPSLILLDEPAAGLSPAERQVLCRLLVNLPRSLTVLLIEHDMEVAFAAADQVTVMENGAVVTEGSPDAVRRDPRLHAIYGGHASHANAS